MPRAVIRKAGKDAGLARQHRVFHLDAPTLPLSGRFTTEDPLCDRTCGFYRKLRLRQNNRS